MPSSKPTFLTETYSGYLHRDVPPEDVDLTPRRARDPDRRVFAAVLAARGPLGRAE